VVLKKREKRNKEEADFDEFEDVFQDDDKDDIVNKGLDYIPDDDSEEEELFGDKELGNKNSKEIPLNRKDTKLNEDGNKMLKVSWVLTNIW